MTTPLETETKISPLQKVPFLTRILHFSCRSLHEVFSFATVSSAFEETLIDYKVGQQILQHNFLSTSKGRNVSNIIHCSILSKLPPEMLPGSDMRRHVTEMAKGNYKQVMREIEAAKKKKNTSDNGDGDSATASPNEDNNRDDDDNEKPETEEEKAEREKKIEEAKFMLETIEVIEEIVQEAKFDLLFAQQDEQWSESKKKLVNSLKKEIGSSLFARINNEIKWILLKTCIADLDRIFRVLVFDWNLVDETRDGFVGNMNFSGRFYYPKKRIEYTESEVLLTTCLCLALQRKSKKILYNFFFPNNNSQKDKDVENLFDSSSILWKEGVPTVYSSASTEHSFSSAFLSYDDDHEEQKTKENKNANDDDDEENESKNEKPSSPPPQQRTKNCYRFDPIVQLKKETVPFFAAVSSGDKEIVKRLLSLKKKNSNDEKGEELLVDPYAAATGPKSFQAGRNPFSSISKETILDHIIHEAGYHSWGKDEKIQEQYEMMVFFIDECKLDIRRFTPLVDSSTNEEITDPEKLKKYYADAALPHPHPPGTLTLGEYKLHPLYGNPFLETLEKIGTDSLNTFEMNDKSVPTNNDGGKRKLKNWDWRVKFIKFFYDHGVETFFALRDFRNNSMSNKTKLPRFCWIPDEVSDSCRRCTQKFGTFTNRRDHCERCGELVCSACLKSVKPNMIRSDGQPENFLKRTIFADKLQVCSLCEIEIGFPETYFAY